MTPAARLSERLAECEAIGALLSAAGFPADDVAPLVIAARRGALADALAMIGPRDGAFAAPERQPRAPAPPPAEPQVFGPEAVARTADAAVSALPPGPPAPPPAPAPGAGAAPARAARPTAIYTAERLALLYQLWGTPARTEEVLDRLNALPGTPITSTASLVTKCKSLPDLPPRPHWTMRLLEEERRALGRKLGTATRDLAQARAAGKLSEERDAALRLLWPDLSLTTPEVAARISALPGDEVNDNWVWRRALALGLPSSRQVAAADAARAAATAAGSAPAPAPEPAPAVAAEPPPEPAPMPAPPPREVHGLADLTAEDRADAERMVLQERQGARALSEEFGWSLDLAQRIAAQIRAAAAPGQAA